ncbi:MAG: hypothetical protein U9O18_08725 [Chloroflexota bacterium]|nr:hypothetical protein [Chloroflexota bacterium]
MHVRVRAGVVAFAAACLALTSIGCGEPTAEDRVADTMRRTEDIRGLSAIEPVPYRFLPGDEAFDDLIDDWLESDAARGTEADALVMQRLGLLPLGFDILEVLEWSTRTGVLGYYDPEAKRMTVVSDPDDVGPGDLLVLAHEHAHALQDQHFGLDRDDGLDGDEAAAFDALVEGEATLVMAIWAMKRLGAMDVEELEASDIPTDVMPVDEVPDILYRLGEFPYVDGAAFVFDKWGDGDWSAIDALWANPPVSSEQILHPERYPDDVPDVVEMPDIAAALGPGWEVAAEMVVGEMQIGVLLADGEPWDYSDDDVAFTFPELANARAAEGWGGDRLVHVTGPEDDWVIVWQTTWDRSRDAREFSAAAGAAFVDLPFSAVVIEGTDVTDGSLRHPVLVMITHDVAARVRTLAALAPT